MIPSYEMKIAFLKKRDIIKQLKKKTGITLEDLLKKKIFIAKPESHDTILRQYIDSANYGDLKGTDFDDSDLSPIPAEYWPISFSQQLSDQECQELKKNFFSEGRLVQDAALLVMAITESDSLTDSEKQSIDDRINKAIR